MISTIKNKLPIARKEHKCDLCGETIHKGETYHRQTNVYEGDVYDWIEHLDCRDVASECGLYWLDECADDGLDMTTFKENVYEIYAALHDENEAMNLTTNEQVKWIKENIAKVKEYLRA